MNQSSGLRFDVYERVHLPVDVADIHELEEIELVPHIQVVHQGDQVLLRGNLLLSGVYGSEGEATDSRTLEHWIPVEITLPMNRVRSLEDITVEIDNFDVDLLSARTLNITGVLSLTGVETRDQTPPSYSWGAEPFTVVHTKDEAPEQAYLPAEGAEAQHASEVPAYQQQDESERDKGYAAGEQLPAAAEGAAEETADTPEPASAAVQDSVRTQQGSSQQEKAEQVEPVQWSSFSFASDKPAAEEASQPAAWNTGPLRIEENEAYRQYRAGNEPGPWQNQEAVRLPDAGSADSAHVSWTAAEDPGSEASEADTAAEGAAMQEPALEAVDNSESEREQKPAAWNSWPAEFASQTAESHESSSDMSPNERERIESAVEASADQLADKAAAHVEQESEALEANAAASVPLGAAAAGSSEELAEVVTASADMPATAAEPVIQQDKAKQEMKIALGAKRPEEAKAGASDAGYSSLLQTSKRDQAAKAAELEQEFTAKAQERKAQLPSEGDEIEWKKLFLSKSDGEREFRRVRMCIVQREDTLETIAGRYELNPRELQLYNRLNEQSVSEGQVLMIP
ncbi:hypothetical protein DNH61_19335 [Paenibacillus sambharensis]|uniref:LysM domain-containing protein n=1 Tax=Paenibacillus sambharensis TaxID=1803190 RepID=A0A2W1LQJ6_9BACL|nr:LysM peptidoglycan-binding domain-containing protein [Paenibacillus sambharensis]PZD94111.1 hypothetical protein DNH61_19335 [Paenibacillus sambharensis]